VLKLGLPDWVRPACGWTGLSTPPNPTGNPNFNLKKRPDRNKSGPEVYRNPIRSELKYKNRWMKVEIENKLENKQNNEHDKIK
jgi:hypothetical protein